MTSGASPSKPERVNVDVAQVQEIYDNYGVSAPTLEQALLECLRERGWETYEDSDEFRNDLHRSFEDAYLQETGQLAVPEALTAAAEDATYWIRRRLPSSSEDLNDHVAATYTALTASILPSYSRRGLDPHGSAQFLPPSDGTEPASN